MPRALQLAAVGTAAGAFSGLFGVGGAALANSVPERALEVSFATLQPCGASQHVRRALRPQEKEPA
jgi:hypothetical protein